MFKLNILLEMINIYVDLDDDHEGRNFEKGIHFKIKHSRIIINGGESVTLSFLEKGQTDPTSNEITFHFMLNGKCINSLSPNLVFSKRISNFLHKLRPEEDIQKYYCCFDFTNEIINGRGLGRKNKICGDDYIETSCFYSDNDDENVIIANKNRQDVVYEINQFAVLIDKNGTVKHSAFAIGHGLFISLFGSSGGLIITDMENMLMAFNAVEHYRLNAFSE